MTQNKTKYKFLNFLILLLSGAAWLYLSTYYFPFIPKSNHAKYFTYWLFIVGTIQVIAAIVKLFDDKDQSNLFIDMSQEKNERQKRN
jgi:hypothetical protein